MGHRRISVCTKGNTNSDGHADAHGNSNANAQRYRYPNSNGHAYARSNYHAHGNPDALSSNRSGLCRRENYGRADHLAERRIHYGGNHGWAAGA